MRTAGTDQRTVCTDTVSVIWVRATWVRLSILAMQANAILGHNKSIGIHNRDDVECVFFQVPGHFCVCAGHQLVDEVFDHRAADPLTSVLKTYFEARHLAS